MRPNGTNQLPESLRMCGKLRLDHDFRTKCDRRLAEFDRFVLDAGDYRRAAVAIVLVDYRGQDGLGITAASDDEPAIVLTRRAGGLKRHAGQWALPGGRLDKGEDAITASLRELEEEVGLSLTEASVLGQLDDFITRSGYHITPVVFWGGPVVNLVGNPGEVASIHRIPCRELLRADAPMLEQSVSSQHPVLYMPLGSTCVATPTAAIIYQFREVVLFGRSTRVSHYEQPRFAWR